MPTRLLRCLPLLALLLAILLTIPTNRTEAQAHGGARPVTGALPVPR